LRLRVTSTEMSTLAYIVARWISCLRWPSRLVAVPVQLEWIRLAHAGSIARRRDACRMELRWIIGPGHRDLLSGAHVPSRTHVRHQAKVPGVSPLYPRFWRGAKET